MHTRITGGSFKGLYINIPESARPTTSKSREALMASISPYIRDSEVLDVFSGSGSVGIEMISRGAKHVVFVENNFKAFSQIKNNLIQCKCLSYATLIKGDALKKVKSLEKKFDIIFLDPPFDFIRNQMDILHEFIEDNVINKLQQAGILVLEFPKDFLFTIQKWSDNNLYHSKIKTLGSSFFLIINK